MTRLVLVPGEYAPVGLAGFHGPPDEVGIVEVGYRIGTVQRRKGHARQALETLLAVARAHPDVQVVRATISPANHASRSLVEGYGFEEVGEQWDDQEGLEIILEVAAGDANSPGEQPIGDARRTAEARPAPLARGSSYEASKRPWKARLEWHGRANRGRCGHNSVERR